jgi:hypothetical protein
MKRPASQFYWGDWLVCQEVRAVSLAARGLWMDMLCYMRQGEPIGHLTHRDGHPISAAQLARMVGESVRVVGRLLAELERAGVPGKADNGAYTSRRMLRDEQEYQQYRAGQAEAGKRGAAERWGSPSPPHPGAHPHPIPDPKKNTWGDDGSSSPSPSSSPSSSSMSTSKNEDRSEPHAATSEAERTKRASRARVRQPKPVSREQGSLVDLGANHANVDEQDGLKGLARAPAPLPTQEALAHYIADFEARYTVRPTLSGQKDGPRMARLLRTLGGLDAVRARIDAYFSSTDAFFAEARHTLDLFFAAGTQTKLAVAETAPRLSPRGQQNAAVVARVVARIQGRST